MSGPDSARPILSRAGEQEAGFNWLEAAEYYRKALAIVPRDDPATADLYERSGYSLYRGAMQANNPEEFRELMHKAILDHDRAKRLYLAQNQSDGSTKALRCDGMIAYLGYWLASEAGEKKKLLEEAWRFAKDALKAFQSTGDALEYWKTLDRLAPSPLIASLLTWDSSNIEKLLAEGLEHAERAVELLSKTGNLEELARAYVMTAGWLDQSSFWLHNPDNQEKYRERARIYWSKGKALSEQAALFQIGILGPLACLGVGSEEILIILRNALALAHKTRDKSIIGGLQEFLGFTLFWKKVGAEDPRDVTRFLDEALENVKQAQQNYSSILYASPGNGALWVGEPYPEYFWDLASRETDQGKKRELLEKALQNTPRLLEVADRSGYPIAISAAHHVASKIFESLAKTEREIGARKAFLEKAVGHRKESIRITEQVNPYDFTNRGVDQNYLANIKKELATFEENQVEKRKLLEQAVVSKETCLNLRLKAKPWLEKSPSNMVWNGERELELGDLLNSVQKLNGDKTQLKRAAEAFENAAEFFQRSNLASRITESYWRLARVHEALSDYLNAAKEFDLASESYGQAAENIPQLKDLYESHSRYMKAWSAIMSARYHHAREEYGIAKKYYDEAARLHKSTTQWSFLSSNYAAWAQVENAEDLSRREESNEAVDAFENAGQLFEESKRSILGEINKIENVEERESATNLVRVADLRGEYCGARIILEEAKTLDRKGDHNSSSEKYGHAVELFEKIVQKLGTDPAEQDLKLIITLSKAWRAMTRAEADVSPELYLQASKLFEEAKQLSPTERSKTLAVGHSRFCKALDAGARFADTRDPALHDNALKDLETAANLYVKAGFPSASEYTRACKLLFDAYLYMDEANKEKDQQRKAKLYLMTERVLEGSAESFAKADYPGRREEVLKLLNKVKEDREIAASLSELFHPPSIISATMSFTTPRPTFEQAVGLERFEHANIQASLISRDKSLKTGEDLDLELELVNAGRGPAQLVKIEEIVPKGFDLSEKPERYTIEDSYLDMQGKLLDSLKTEEVRLVLKPRVPGQFTVKPRILYLDDSGRYKSYEPEPVEVTVLEPGASALPGGQRRLAAIMFTDMVGYTALSRKNETLAMDLLQQHREILRSLLQRHNGREVKTMGDAFLVEFASTLDAVKCGYDFQKSLHDRNMATPMERRIIVRVGIHLGDVIHNERDVYGDAVNVASRIEPLADPGGICVSGQVYESVKNSLSYTFENLRLRELKDVADTIMAYRIVLPWREQYSPIPVGGKDIPSE